MKYGTNDNEQYIAHCEISATALKFFQFGDTPLLAYMKSPAHYFSYQVFFSAKMISDGGNILEACFGDDLANADAVNPAFCEKLFCDPDQLCT